MTICILSAAGKQATMEFSRQVITGVSNHVIDQNLFPNLAQKTFAPWFRYPSI
jgi:hypothetical protein